MLMERSDKQAEVPLISCGEKTARRSAFVTDPDHNLTCTAQPHSLLYSIFIHAQVHDKLLLGLMLAQHHPN
jgi:hypothetical protein